MSLPCLGEAVTDGLSLLVLAAGAFFCGRRLLLPRVRALSTPYDFALLALVMLPLLTGVMAYHHLFDYHTVILLHMAAGEFVLMAIPFTKLMHAFFFVTNRFLVAGEHSFIRRSIRAW